MKFPYFRRSVSPSHGFTLVELLVVIGIIAILASVILSIIPGIIKTAKRAKAQNMAVQIQTAMMGYYNEYSVYPTPTGITASSDYELTDSDTGNQGGAPNSTSWGSLIECLSGMISPSAGTTLTTTSAGFTNTRQIIFLSLKSSDVGNGGTTTGEKDAPLNTLPPNTTQLYFNIAVDTDYDGVLGGTSSSSGWLPAFNPVTTSGSLPTTGSSTAGVAVWANCVGNVTPVNSNQWVHTY